MEWRRWSGEGNLRGKGQGPWCSPFCSGPGIPGPVVAMVIVVDYGDDVQHYAATFANGPLPRPSSCPTCCVVGHLIGHGSYPRTVAQPTQTIPIRIQRLLCTACHQLKNWTDSSHATSTATWKGTLTNPWPAGAFPTVAENACLNCHRSHSAGHPQRLLAQSAEPDNCTSCHNGAVAEKNIAVEFLKPFHHPIEDNQWVHDPKEDPAIMPQHVTCVDCHNSHTSQRVTDFSTAPKVRASQAGVAGISAKDGKTVVSPAVNQYETCLRCHGTSTGKKASINFGYLPRRVVSAPDPLNVIPEFDSLATSSHPVFQDRRSMLPQPSLRSYMLNLDGKTAGRPMGNQIFCTDCHNSDDNREFGGQGPNGPHGSIFPQILARRYEFSTAPVPGGLVTNLFVNPNLSADGGSNGGPYALCAKCHDLTRIMSDESWNGHSRHVAQDGFSCSVCHTAHGVPAQSGSISGERLVDFDVNVVAQPTDLIILASLRPCDDQRAK